MIALALVLGVACPTKAPATAPAGAPDAFVGQKIERTCVLGAADDIKGSLFAVVDPRQGMPLTLEGITDDLEHLVAGGAVRDARAIAVPLPKKAVMVLYVVEEYARLEAVTVTGNAVIDTGTYVGGFEVGLPFSPARPRLFIERLKERYGTLGYQQAQVEFRIEPATKGRVKLAFTVTEGKKRVVEAIKFQGVKTLREAELRLAVKSTTGALYVPDLAERDVMAINDVMYEHGLVIGKVEQELRGDDLVFTISEGPVFRVGKLELKGWAWGDDPRPSLETKPGDVFSRLGLRSDMERLRSKAKLKGATIEITPVTSVDTDKHTVDLTFEFEKQASKSITF